MAGINEKWKTSMVNGAHELLGQEILAAGMFSRAGSTSGALTSIFSPLMALFVGGKNKKKSGGLPHDFVLAVTATNVYALKCKQGMSVKVTEQLKSWTRDGLSVRIEKKGMGTKLFFTGGGEGVQIESKKGSGKINADVIALLEHGVASPVAQAV